MYQFCDFFSDESVMEGRELFKDEFQDKSTNQTFQNMKQSQQYLEPQVISPKQINFFLSPTSPRNQMVYHHHYPVQQQALIEQNGKQISPIIDRNLLSDQDSEIRINRIVQMPINDRFKMPPDRSKRNAKGLKNLSERVYQIVIELRVTNYKQVAEKLIDELQDQQDVQKKYIRIKDQHNVKRRVYDALNVLIATGILKKQGKKVMIRDYKRKGAKYINTLKEERQKLEEDQRKKVLSIKTKLAKIAILEEKKNTIKYIMKRNQMGLFKEEEILRFPLIATICEEDSLKKVQRGEKSQSLQVKFQKKFDILGDIDIMLRVNTDTLQMQSYLKKGL